MKKQLPVIFIVAMFTLALLPIQVDAYQQLVGQIMDLGHFFAFGFMALLLRQYWHARGIVISLLWAFSLTLLFALIIELLQPWFDRQSTWSDFVNSLFGVLVALFGYWLWYCQSRYSLRVVHGLASLLLFAWIAMPVFISLSGVWWKQNNFPNLADFDHYAERSLWQVYGKKDGLQAQSSISPTGKTSGCCSLKIVSLSGVWSGIGYQAEGMDWRGYKQIEFDIYNPSESFVLGIRIDDDRSQKLEQRYQEQLKIEPGINHLSVSFSTIRQAVDGKPFNFGSIRQMLFFIHKNDQVRLFYIDSIRLAR